MINYFMFDGKSSKDFGVYISGTGVFNAPERDVEEIEVPGRNGTIIVDNGRYKNLSLSYPAFIYRNYKNNVSGLRNYLLSHHGYYRLEDTYHPDEYRMARYSGGFEAEPVDMLTGAEFTLNFDCKPQRFLKSGEMEIDITSNTTIFNETYHDAKPLIRAYGTGSFSIGDITITIDTADEYTDIDCETMEAYKDDMSTNCNGNITLEDGEFPVLASGENTITLTDITELILTPRWWIL